MNFDKDCYDLINFDWREIGGGGCGRGDDDDDDNDDDDDAFFVSMLVLRISCYITTKSPI